MSLKLLKITSISLVAIFICTAQGALADSSFASSIEAAQGGDVWNKQEVISAKLNVRFGGKQRVNGHVSMNPSASKTRLVLDGGAIIVFDGEKAWITPKDAPYKKPRFDALTWPYFLAAPFKLDDSGVNLKSFGEKKLLGKMYDVAKITFGSNVGDSPDDWYILYRDKETKQLKAMAYIVTYGKKGKSSAKEPHAIVYNNVKKVKGVSLATDWKFYNWSLEKGVFGDSIGTASVSELEFKKNDDALFKAPAKSVEAKLP